MSCSAAVGNPCGGWESVRLAAVRSGTTTRRPIEVDDDSIESIDGIG
ncbi:hypothetical protein [Natrinema soli]|uniref:Uncharacterized protein n=1 Tax=Natrinema soli TaxID=1930624 RepID=A0ABD5SM08_9EURY|nr:hypothetical protein [Natrinema soli]